MNWPLLIAVDVDGVIAALHDEWYRLYNQDYNDTLTADAILTWDTHKYVKPECGKKIYEYLHRPDLYDGVSVIPGSLEGVNKLREMGHRIIFVTTCVKGMTDQKWDWLERHGFLPAGRHNQADLVIAADKSLIAADCLIDDKAETIVEWAGLFRPGIIFDQPWNRTEELDGIVYRAKSWQDVVDYFLPVEVS